jgi:hypothetical protein
MEQPKRSPEEERAARDRWADALAHTLAAEFPDANIHTDSEYFIYTVIKPSGERVEVHTPKWPKVPKKNPDDSVTHVKIEDLIRDQLAK